MKILFCSHIPLDPRLGAPKAMLELAAELEKLGWSARLASDEEICPGTRHVGGLRKTVAFGRALRTFVEANAKDFDVVDYEHVQLPFARSSFAPATLLVARVALLMHHFARIRIPGRTALRSRVASVVKGPLRLAERAFYVRRATRTLETADLINVSNEYDRVELVGRGFESRKIAVLPLGLSDARLASFSQIDARVVGGPRVAFVGTFDPRKGATDFPLIVAEIVRALPACRFRFLGGHNLGDEGVLRSFPERFRDRIEVTSSFEPDALPGLLRDCSLGIFPSYIEGFGFGVAEMLAASLPVIAYDAPGPPSMLPAEYLVTRGHARELAATAVSLLKDRDALVAARIWARQRALGLTWQSAAKRTSDAYVAAAARLRADAPKSAIRSAP